VPVKKLKRNIFQRILGKCITQEPEDDGCCVFSGGKVVIDLNRAPELDQPGGAIRLEGNNLPERILVVRGDDGKYRAFCNRCSHAGRRLDPVPGTETVQCCSMGVSTFDYEGKVLAGSAKKPVTVYPVNVENKKLTVSIRLLQGIGRSVASIVETRH